MMLRAIGAAFVLAPMALRLKPALIRVENPPLQLLRVLCMAGDTFAFYWATRSMPLADVMTFYMAAPLIVTALSAPLLGEKVERFRWIAVLIGFVGVVIALQAHAADVLLGLADRARSARPCSRSARPSPASCAARTGCN